MTKQLTTHKYAPTRDEIRTVAEIVGRHREWHLNLQSRFELHPAVLAAIELAPFGWHETLLQWPHRSQDDPKLLAYTRNEAHGKADRQTKVAVGKYIKSRCPNLSDHVIRDLVFEAAAEVASGFSIVSTTEEMVNAVQTGPSSCMQWDYDFRVHPYACYAPQFGWSMAIRKVEGCIVSRALLHTPAGGNTYYVRCYGNCGEDDELAGWLRMKDIEYRGGWRSGTKLAYITGGHGDPLLPYIDGSLDRVREGQGCFVLDSNGEYTCTNTDGTADYEHTEACENCGEHYEPDDMRAIGRSEDTLVCDSCIHNDFRFVEGRGGHEYYVHEDNAVEIDDTWYDSVSPPRPYVQLHDGNYAFREAAVEVDGDWYRRDDEDVVMLEDGEWIMRDDAWMCDGTGDWYSDDDEPVTIDGRTYHSDYVDSPGYVKPQGSISNEAQVPLAYARPDPFTELRAARDAGLTIEMRIDGGWHECVNPWFDADPSDYRIKNTVSFAGWRTAAEEART